MKRIKLLMMLILISTLSTGCSVEYNITVNKDTIKEEIIVNDVITSTRTKEKILNHYNKWYPTYVNYITSGESMPLPNYNKKYNRIEYHDKSIIETNNGYQYKYIYNHNLNKYYDAYSLASAFADTTIHDSDNVLLFKTSKKSFLCKYDYFDKLIVNIKIDKNLYIATKHNAEKVKNNTYSWTINKDECENKPIELVLERIHDEKTKKNKKSTINDYALYIFCGILLILVIIGYFIIKKKKQKLDDFDIDD